MDKVVDVAMHSLVFAHEQSDDEVQLKPLKGGGPILFSARCASLFISVTVTGRVVFPGVGAKLL